MSVPVRSNVVLLLSAKAAWPSPACKSP